MANTDFGILLKTLLDKSGINSELEQVQKIVNKYSIDIMPELKTASLRNQMKAVSQEIANDFNKAFGTNLTGNDVFKAYENQAKQAEKAISDVQKKRQAEQEKYYNKIISNNKEIYSLKEKKLSADKEESKELQRQITNLEKRNKRAYDSISQKGLGDTQWGLEVSNSEKELKNRLAIKEARLQDKTNAQEQANVERQIAEYNKQELEYQKQRKQYEAEGIKQAQDEELLRQSMEYYEQEKYYQDTRAKYLAEGKAQEEAYNAEVKETTEYYKQVAKGAEKVYESRQRLAEANTKKVNKIQLSLDVGDYDVEYKSFETSLKKLGFSGDELENKLKGVKTTLDDLKASATKTEVIPDDVIENARLLDVEIEKISNDIKTIKLDNSLFADDIKVNDTITRLNEQLRKNTAYSTEAKHRIEDWINELKKGDVAEARLKSINSEAKELHAQMAKLGKIGKSFTQTIKEGAKSFLEWTISSVSVMEVVQAVRLAVDNVIELDSQLLELSKVSDLSADGLAKVTEEAYDLGKTVGKTGTQVLDAITTYKRAGFDLADSTKMAEDALKMVNVAEGIDDASESAQYLISIMKGYQDTSSAFSKKILDSINEVSNTQAVDFDNLADGAQRLSAVANQAGVSFDQMLGVLTGGYEVLGNMEKTASGLITIFTRLQSIQLSDEEEVESVAKLQESFSSATNGVVNIVDQTTGQLRGAYDILNDLNDVWDTLDKNTQEGLAFAAGGTRQKSVFLSIMSNWESVEKSVKSASESMGSAEIENQKYLDSLNGKISQFESAVESLSNTLLDSDLLGFFVDFGTGAVNSLDTVIDKFGTLGTLTTIGSGIAGATGHGLTNYVT